MTDEEKAEEYAEKITYIIKGRTILTRSEINQRYAGIVQGVLYGLAEGRKEKCLEQNKDGTIRPCELIKDFEKEKCELLGIIQGKDEVIEQLKERLQIESQSLHEQCEIVSKQVDQIEKMKNCSNCNGIINGIRQEKCKFCMRSKLLSDWELAE